MKTHKDFGDRLEYLIVDILRVSKNEFCTRTGISPGNLTRMINADDEGKKVRPGQEKLEAIMTAYPKVNMDWLVGGKGVPLRETPLKDTSGTLPIQFEGRAREIERELELYKSKMSSLERELLSKDAVIAEKERTISVLQLMMKNMGFQEMEKILGKLHDKFRAAGMGYYPLSDLSS